MLVLAHPLPAFNAVDSDIALLLALTINVWQILANRKINSKGNSTLVFFLPKKYS
jgi:hypothetical protein